MSASAVINSSLSALAAEPNLENGIAVALATLELLEVGDLGSPKDIIDGGLLKLPNAERQDTWFHQHPWMRGERSAFEILDSTTRPIQAKFYWLQKKANAFVAGGVHFTANWEDRDFTRTDNLKVGIDFFLTPDATAVLVVLSNRGNLRVLELSKRLTNTQLEIFHKWSTFNRLETQELIHASLWDSFRLQSVNNQFYSGVSDAYNELLTHLSQGGRDEESAKLFSSRLMGRLIFLWFLRKMNFVAEWPGYFDANLDDQGDYYRTNLEVLFFKTLDKPLADRTIDQLGRLDLETPYLNGGLFSPRADDWVDDKYLSFPDGFFPRLFEHFDNFNFTTDESTPEYEQVAIDPEMLGRVFESLLASQVEATGAIARKSKGAFYTPREIVAFMCRESIRSHLRRLGPGDERLEVAISKLIDTNDQDWAIAGSNSLRDIPTDLRSKIVESLNRVKSLDPACGSGAFPLGFLQVLSKIHLRLDPRLDPFKLKLSILQNNIFGVDIEPMAVEISRLRSWLSLIVEEANSKKVEPLPNLDFNFVCANSLVPLLSEDLLSDQKLQGLLNNLRLEYFSANSPKKKTAIQEQYLKLTSPTLFDDFDGRSRQLKSFNPFDSHQIAEFFDPEHMFGHRSFDVIIGNPPYEVLEGPHWKKFLENVRSIPSYRYSLGGRLNLFRLFIERSWQFMAGGGVLSFIVPSTLIADKNTSGIRRMFMKEGSLDYLIEFPEKENVFQSVTQATTIFHFRTAESSAPFKLSVGLNTAALPPAEAAYLTWGEVLMISGEDLSLPLIKSSEELKLLEAIKEGSLELQEVAKCYKGDINLGYFRQALSNSDTGVLLVRGEHVQPFSVDMSETNIDRRWIQLEQAMPGSQSRRIVLQNVANMGLEQRVIAGLIPAGVVVADSCNCVEATDSRVDNDYLLAVLNSKLINWYFKKFSTNNHLNVYELESLPIKLPTVEQSQNISQALQKLTVLGEAVLSSESRSERDKRVQIMAEIDETVFQIYGLEHSQITTLLA